MKAKLFVLAILPLFWGAASRAQQNPATASSTTANTTVASITISGTIADATTGQPLRRASVSLRTVNGGANRGNNNNNNNGGRGAPGPGGIDPLSQNPLVNNLPGGPANAGGQGNNNQGNNNQGNNRGNNPGNNQGNNQGPPGGFNGGRNQVTTGDDGTYSFPNVNPGQYQVVVERDGFISQEYGQRSWVSGTGATLTLTAGQKLTSINISMVPAGTIAGKVRDETGEPMVGVQVQALAFQYQNGSKSLVSERQVVTDDLGNYRLYWLSPGEYYVSATPNGRRNQQTAQNIAARAQQAGLTQVGNQINAAIPAPGIEEAYAPTYYPGGVDPENAVAVALPPAQDVGGMDFVLRPIQMLTVSGKITPFDVSSIPLTPAQQQAQQRQQTQQAQGQQNNGRGGRGNTGNNNNGNNGNNNNGNNNNNNGNRGRGNFNFSNIDVILTRIGPYSNNGRGGGRGGGGRGGPDGFGGPSSPRANVAEDGSFQISNVIPGSYNLTAVQQASGMSFTARTRVEVGYANVPNINLVVAPGIDIKGQVATEDGKSPTNFRLNNVRVQLTPVDDVRIGNVQAQVQTDGTFTLTGVPAMSYKVNVSGVSGGYVIAGRFDNNDVLNQPLQVEQGQTGSNLSIQVGFQPASVSGEVRDAKDQPFQAATCVLVPAARNRIDLYKTASSDQNGKVAFSNVAPGDYKIFAWESVPTGAYQDADYLKQFEDKGKLITIAKGGSYPMQINVIPARAQ